LAWEFRKKKSPKNIFAVVKREKEKGRPPLQNEKKEKEKLLCRFCKKRESRGTNTP